MFFLQNIENHVAWFHAEPCKVKGVEEGKRNMCQTELNRGYLASCIKLFVDSLVGGFEFHNFLSSDFLDLNRSKI
jgi:hypothetical protein